MLTKQFIVRLINAAQRDYDKQQKSVQNRIIAKLTRLQENPYPPYSMKLSGRRDSYRIRVGDYRVLFSIDEETRIIWITRIAHRREVYK
ncbi:MAG: type II toxin-antitoxin system RelE/ParE family toxin [Calditrichaeota bacterium]|nr:type II toxin-antitoxin system RelE/ParE family toxin [Calditrichota bacterium]